MGSGLALVTTILLAGPIAQAPADGRYVVELEMSHETEGNYFYAPGSSAFPVQVPVDVPVTFRLSVSDAGGEPTDVEDTSQLLEIRREGGGSRVRFADMERISPGVYETTHTFRQAGRWVAVVQPDVEDRSDIPEGSGEEVLIRVLRSEPDAAAGPSSTALVAVVAVILLVASLMIYAARHRRHPTERPPQPVPHDTWWNSP